MSEERRFTSLDEAVAHINATEVVGGDVLPKLVELLPPEQESRWWSYTSKQNIIPEGEAVQHCASEHEVRNASGVRYQKCGGGRRIIRKHIGRN